MAPLIDTHCHLDADDFAGDRDAVVAAAAAAGVGEIVVPAIAPANFAAVRRCCERYAACRPAYGIHPLRIGGLGSEHVARVDDWLTREALGAFPPVAIGEIGLDFFVEGYDEKAQEAMFAAQLKLAATHGLPVLLHVRRAIDRVLKHVRRVELPGGIAHAFNGSRQQADAFIAMGLKLGFGGTLTYPRATRIRALAQSLPLASIVLETDAPDIAPEWSRGQRNTPAQLAPIAAALAELRGESLSTIAAATTANARSVFAARPTAST